MSDSLMVEREAIKLTKEQRRILTIVHGGGEWFPITWEGWTFKSLQRRGLAYPREPGMQTLSPFGQKVRAHLLGDKP